LALLRKHCLQHRIHGCESDKKFPEISIPLKVQITFKTISQHIYENLFNRKQFREEVKYQKEEINPRN